MTERRPGRERRSGALREALVTLAVLAVAAVLAALAALYVPEAPTPQAFSDVGQLFYPGFQDATAVAAVEIVAYDEATATATPLKVQLSRGRFVMPSHHDYPAAAKERLADLTAALIGLRKEILRSLASADHERYGVIDPLDPSSPSLAGRGTRVTVRDASESVLADFILGRDWEDEPGYRYVRVPGHKSTYAAKLDVQPSARFQDWVAPDLLGLRATDIRKLTIVRYSVDEQFGGVRGLERTVLTREADDWSLEGEGRLHNSRVSQLVATVAELPIVDVAPKPDQMAADLAEGGIQPTLDAVFSLRRRGFFVTPTGRLLANEGELRIETAKGVSYVLRFGEIVGGAAPPPDDTPAPRETTSGAPASAPVTPTPPPAPPEEAQRYLMVTAAPAGPAAPASATTPDPAAERLARRLNQRFAPWYYVISGSDFTKLRPARKDLVR